MLRFLFSLLATFTLIGTLVSADEIAVTVYNDNLAVISETRTLQFEKGRGRLAFTDVPALIDAASVQFEVLDGRQAVSILEQNYAFDLVSPEQMYAKYIDQQIELIDKEGNRYGGKLLSYNGAAVTIQETNGSIKIIQLSNIVHVSFPLLPEGLITRPTLFWNYNSTVSGNVNSRVSYQTSGMNWSAEYVAVLDESEKNLSLSGWSSINNTSGKSYKDAALKLVAGTIHRAVEPPILYGDQEVMMRAAPSAVDGFQQKQFFEYHLYTLPRRATVADKETKQISLFDPAQTGVSKIYRYQPHMNATDVKVSITFKNSQQAGLGMPLPGGRVRVFKGDDDGSMILLGEDRLSHTPKDEEVKLTIGNAFDIKAEEKLVNQTQISSKVTDQECAIELRNHKDTPVTVQVEKKLYGFWEILESSHKHTKEDATTVLFDVPVAANGESTLKLKVRFTVR